MNSRLSTRDALRLSVALPRSVYNPLACDGTVRLWIDAQDFTLRHASGFPLFDLLGQVLVEIAHGNLEVTEIELEASIRRSEGDVWPEYLTLNRNSKDDDLALFNILKAAIERSPRFEATVWQAARDA
jgi:hypothetical protein